MTTKAINYRWYAANRRKEECIQLNINDKTNSMFKAQPLQIFNGLIFTRAQHRSKEFYGIAVAEAGHQGSGKACAMSTLVCVYLLQARVANKILIQNKCKTVEQSKHTSIKEHIVAPNEKCAGAKNNRIANTMQILWLKQLRLTPSSCTRYVSSLPNVFRFASQRTRYCGNCVSAPLLPSINEFFRVVCVCVCWIDWRSPCSITRALRNERKRFYGRFKLLWPRETSIPFIVYRELLHNKTKKKLH